MEKPQEPLQSPDDSYLDDLPGHPDFNKGLENPIGGVDAYRGSIGAVFNGVQFVELLPKEQEIIREAIYKKFKQIECRGLGRDVIKKIADIIINFIDEYKFTPRQIKRLIIHIFEIFEYKIFKDPKTLSPLTRAARIIGGIARRNLNYHKAHISRKDVEKLILEIPGYATLVAKCGAKCEAK